MNKYGFPFQERKPRLPNPKYFIPAVIIMAIIFFFIFKGCAKANNYTDTEIANAIYYAEGGNKTAYPYGIKSLKYENRTDKELSKEQWARKICLNTIKNNRKRFSKQEKYTDFIDFLGSRYCPIQGKHLTNDEKKFNIYWVKNVKLFLKKGCSSG